MVDGAAPGIGEIPAGLLPQTLSRARVVVTPYPFGVSDADHLRVVSVNAKTGVTLEIHGRQAVGGFESKPFRYTHTPNTDRTVRTEDFTLGGGLVTNLTVFASGASPVIGQTFVIVQLVRSQGATAYVMGTLLAGYVTASQAIGWPGSPIVNSFDGTPALRVIQGTTPAVGSFFSETVPAGARWRLLSFEAAVNTDAAAGNRQAILEVFVGGNRMLSIPQVHLTVPSSSSAYFWLPGLPVTIDYAANGPGIAGLPTPCDLPAGAEIRNNGVSFSPGDQWAAPNYIVEEYLDF